MQLKSEAVGAFGGGAAAVEVAPWRVQGQVLHSAIAAVVAKLLLAVCPLQLFLRQLRCWSI